MLKLKKGSNCLYIGIDHSVNKSAVCAVDYLGNIIKAAHFEKTKSGHKYIFSYFERDQIKIVERVINIKNEGISYTEKNFSTGKIVNLRSDDLVSMVIDNGELTRTILICHFIIDFLEGLSMSELSIVIEGYAFFAPGNIALIAENVGYLKALIAKKRWKYKMVQPNSIKRALTGFGGGGKDAMKLALKEKYGVCFPNDDLNDAFAMAEYSRMSKESLS